MPTETLPTRKTHKETTLTRGFYAALTLHLLVFAALGLAAFLNHRNTHWGDTNPNPGSIQASMVNALPLPPRQRFKEDSVLASDKPSVAPTPPPPTPEPKAKATPVPPPKAAPPPKPNEILIPNKVQPKPATKPADRPQPAAPKRVTPPPPPTPKATSGETAGIQIPQSVTQLKNGTASITVEERAFGDRYAYYIRLISQKVNEAWNRQEVDASSTGKRTTVTFQIDRDGTPVDPHITTHSSSSSLDTSALRAIQRIDTFGPLPAGDHITIAFSFDFRAP